MNSFWKQVVESPNVWTYLKPNQNPGHCLGQLAVDGPACAGGVGQSDLQDNPNHSDCEQAELMIQFPREHWTGLRLKPDSGHMGWNYCHKSPATGSLPRWLRTPYCEQDKLRNLCVPLRPNGEEIDGCSCDACEMSVSWFKKSGRVLRETLYNKLIQSDSHTLQN